MGAVSLQSEIRRGSGEALDCIPQQGEHSRLSIKGGEKDRERRGSQNEIFKDGEKQRERV